MRRIKLNRDLGRRGSSETAPSDRTQSGSEKSSSISDRSAAAHGSEGDRHKIPSEGAGRKEPASSVYGGVSRERPGSAGDRHRASDREPERERDRPSASDRDRDKSTWSGQQKGSEDREEEGEKFIKAERKTSSNGNGVGRSVSVDKMTIGEKSAICRKLEDQEKPNVSSKECTERAAKSDRLLLCLKQLSIPMLIVNLIYCFLR